MRAAVFKEMSKPLAIETVANPEPGTHGLTEPTSPMPLRLGSVMGHEFAG